MALLEQLLASIGIGNAHLELRVLNKVYSRETAVEGNLVITGGQVAQDIECLWIRLKETDGSDNGMKKELRSQLLATHLTILPHGTATYPFTLAVPRNARVVRRSNLTTDQTFVEAEADIAFALNPRASVGVQITWQREILAVRDALRSLGFVETTSLFALPTGNHDYSQAFAPPPNLGKQFDGLILHIDAGELWIQGQVLITRHGQTVTESLRAFVGGNRHEDVLMVPRKDLLLPDGTINREPARHELIRILDAAKVLPKTEKDFLLRASAAPQDAPDTLLRPAACTDTTPAEELLRPHDSALPEKLQ